MINEREITRQEAWELVCSGKLDFKTFCDWFEEEGDEPTDNPQA